jgi:hypothetical protein
MRPGPASERGNVLVLFALLVTALLGMAAIVLDLGALRQDRSANRTTADHAASAGALALAAETGTAVQACQDAWAYFLDNSPDAGPAPSAPPCGNFSPACDPAAGRAPVVGTVGNYTVTITNPVLDGDALMQPDAIGSPTQVANPAVDGTPCERIGVRIVKEHITSFARAIGVDRSSTDSHSVARSDVNANQDGVVALLLLETEACNAAVASGQAEVIIKGNGPHPGYISVDSNGLGGEGVNNCTTGGRTVIDAQGTQNSVIRADPAEVGGAAGVIRLFALAPGQGGTARAYEAADVSAGRVAPQPTVAGKPTGRKPVDNLFNCTAAGLDGIAGTADDCASAATVPAHINNLRAQLGGPGVPAGYQVFPRPDTALYPNDSCAPSGSTINVPAGNWYIDCAEFKPNNTTVFAGGNIVARGTIHVQGGSLAINPGGASDGVLYIRSGNLSKTAQAAMTLRRTTVYLGNGIIDLGGGSGSLNWTAPTAGNLEDLALWSESAVEHKMGGQATIDVEGVFFMPNATPFTFAGQGGQTQAKAQFIARRLSASGQGKLIMKPDPDRVVPILIRGARLIR